MEKISGKLWSPKFIELDVCGRPLFANPVTYFKMHKLQVCHIEGNFYKFGTLLQIFQSVAHQLLIVPEISIFIAKN